VNRFEKAYAELTGARHCVATANGTSALFTSLAGLDVGPGDEVILPPYTFVATLNVIFLQYALPVFVDSDIETCQIDARKIEGAVTDRTTALLPVHLGGNPADLDTIMEVSRRREIPVVEDACQAVMGEWRGRKLGTVGATGCFSFQASKNLNSGEGGAILTDDEELADRCYAFHNHSRPRRRGGFDYGSSRAANLRLTEFQAGLLLAQMTRLEEQSKTRDENAAHLTAQLSEIPGIQPARRYEGCTRNGYHIYMLRYEAEKFAGLPRAAFIKALRAEGVPCSGGYRPLNREALIQATLRTRAYRRIYPPEVLAAWEERNRCPVNDRLCQEAVWFGRPRPGLGQWCRRRCRQRPGCASVFGPSVSCSSSPL
jgi:dTDP-4-amino-4,6-dideoxygalactose transaminase